MISTEFRSLIVGILPEAFGEKVYFGKPAGVKSLPEASFIIVSNAPDYHLNGENASSSIRIQLDLWCGRLSGNEEGAAQIRANLSPYKGGIFTRISIASISYGIETVGGIEVHRCSIDFNISAKES